MNELSRYRIVLLRVVLFFIALCLVAAALLPSHRAIAQGLILGSAVSCFNVLHMASRVGKITDAAEKVAGGTKLEKRVGIGFSLRLLTSVIAVMIPLKFPQYFNVIAVVGSLVFAHFLLQILGMMFSIKEEKQTAKEKAKQS